MVLNESSTDSIVPSDEEINNNPLSFFNDKALGFREIVLRQIETCRAEWSKEITRGGQNHVYSKEINDYVPVTIPDQRKVVQQVTQALYDLMLFYFDTTIENKLKELNTEMENLYKTYYDAYMASEKWVPYRQVAEKTKTIQTGPDSTAGVVLLQQYEDALVDYWRSIYQELIKLFKRANELNKRKAMDYK